MRLLSKNEIVVKLLKQGVLKEEIDSISIVFENIFELTEYERITPSCKDESLYIMHDKIALYKNNKYILKDNLDNTELIIKCNSDKSRTISIKINEYKKEFNLLDCNLTIFGLLIPIK